MSPPSADADPALEATAGPGCTWQPWVGWQCPLPPSHAVGWLWANQATSTAYTPSTSFQFNSAGATNTLHRSSVGDYEARFPGLGGIGGTAQVSAYGGNHRCQLERLSDAGADKLVYVRCYAPHGVPVDGRFTLLYLRKSTALPLPGAYWRTELGRIAAVPHFWASEGPIGAPTRSGSRYTYSSLGGNAGMVQSTALVSPLGSSHANCFTASLASALEVTCGGGGGHMISAVPPRTLKLHGAVYTISRYQWVLGGCAAVSTGEPATTLHVCADGPGRYRFRLDGQDYGPTIGIDSTWPVTGSTALVNGLDEPCSVRGWSSTGTGVEVRVECTSSIGLPTESGVRLLFLTQKPAQPTGYSG